MPGETYENLLDDVTPTMSDSVRLVDSSGRTKKSALSKLAGLLLEDDTGVEYDTEAQTIKGAIDELQSSKAKVSVSGHKLIIN